MAHLTLVLENREVRKFVLKAPVTTIGRAQDNDIVINNLALSRRHAQVEVKGGRFEVVDLASQNGVYVNGDRIRQGHPLADRDAITLGTYQFVFHADDAPAPAPRPARPKPPPIVEPEPEEEPADHTPLLVLKFNEVELQRYPLARDSALIGRAKDCDVQIPERRLSRKHCEIFRDDGRWFVKDLGSQNGTYVNRRRIRGSQELRQGDVLNFAEYAVLYLPDGAEYAGPDSRGAEGRGPPEAEVNRVAADETVMPPSYRSDYGYEDEGYEQAVRPEVEDEDPDQARPPPPVAPSPRGDLPRGEPLIDSPRDARAKRKGPARAIRETQRPAEEQRSARPSAPPEPRREEPRREEPRRDRPREEPRDRPREEARDDRRDRRDDRRAERTTDDRRDRWPDRTTDDRRSDREDREDRRTEPEDRRSARPSAKPEARRDKPSPVIRAKVEPPRRGENGKLDLRKRPPARMEADVDDEDEGPRPDEDLESWYARRGDDSQIQEPVKKVEDDDSELIPRGRSSVSRVLSEIMVDKRDVDHNLRGAKGHVRERRFHIDVRHGDKPLFSGPVTLPVTILGNDREADVEIRGRYVAGRHSLLVRVRDSLLLVRLGSSSAVRVNGLPKLQAFLKSGDVIQIDETTIKITED